MNTVILKLTGEKITVSDSELAVLRVQQLVRDMPVKAKAPAAAEKPEANAEGMKPGTKPESTPEAPAN